MARKGKTKVDYFPHVTHTGKTIAVLETRWGNDGYAFWFKLLEMLGDSNDFAYNCNHSADWEYLLSRTRVTEPVAIDILDKLAEIEAIDAECWAQRIVWSDNFVRNLEPVFDRRKSDAPKNPLKCQQDVDTNPAQPPIPTTETDKVKQSKPNKSRAEQSEAKETEPKRCPSSLRPGVVQQADTVYLTAEELVKLQQEYGAAAAERMITLLDGYKTNNPDKSAKYRDDFKVIHSWVIRRFQEEQDYAGPNKRASPAGNRQPKTFIDKLADMAVEVMQDDETGDLCTGGAGCQ